jgi:hypothetical protein
MARWRLFGKSKEKDTSQTEEILEEAEVEPIIEESENEPLAQYSETLYTEESKPKKSKGHSDSDQRIWRDVDSIENKIDTLHITRAKKAVTDLDKKVDRLVSDEDTVEGTADRKPSNVIYVVSKPQPGEVRGDWAVRGHGKIYSHHKTKENAINEARKIAKQRNATVMVQNTDGTFSQGFKPK